MKTNESTNSVAHMLDTVLELLQLKNDAALSRALEVAPPVISKVRNGVQPLGSTLLVKLHEATGITTKEIKALAGLATQ
ncbi:hypothetical protein [Collimonas humicola]|uniref:hypothetical protein n=1 Tax=Collimonas humicola TaxID=2825886 RepID=UPI001B8B32F8|nr:hypothetical protein [Collimonas humicola]